MAVPVPQTAAEEYVSRFLEVQAAAQISQARAAVGRVGEAAAAAAATASEGGLAAFWLRIVREVCFSVSLLNGGAGCPPQLEAVDRRLREDPRNASRIAHLFDEGGGGGPAGGAGGKIKELFWEDAMTALMASRDQQV